MLELNILTQRMEQGFALISERIEQSNKRTEQSFDLMNERIDKNLVEYKATVNEMKAEINDIRGDVKALDIKLNNVVDTLTVAINSTNARIDDMQKRQSRDLAKWGVVITLSIGTIQVIIALVPYFSK